MELRSKFDALRLYFNIWNKYQDTNKNVWFYITRICLLWILTQRQLYVCFQEHVSYHTEMPATLYVISVHMQIWICRYAFTTVTPTYLTEKPHLESHPLSLFNIEGWTLLCSPALTSLWWEDINTCIISAAAPHYQSVWSLLPSLENTIFAMEWSHILQIHSPHRDLSLTKWPTEHLLQWLASLKCTNHCWPTIWAPKVLLRSLEKLNYFCYYCVFHVFYW